MASEIVAVLLEGVFNQWFKVWELVVAEDCNSANGNGWCPGLLNTDHHLFAFWGWMDGGIERGREEERDGWMDGRMEGGRTRAIAMGSNWLILTPHRMAAKEEHTCGKPPAIPALLANVTLSHYM